MRRQYDEYEARYHETQRRISVLEERREARAAKRGKLKGYLDVLRKQGRSGRLNITLWCDTVEQVRIKEDGTMRFIFMDGLWWRGKAITYSRGLTIGLRIVYIRLRSQRKLKTHVHISTHLISLLTHDIIFMLPWVSRHFTGVEKRLA